MVYKISYKRKKYHDSKYELIWIKKIDLNKLSEKGHLHRNRLFELELKGYVKIYSNQNYFNIWERHTYIFKYQFEGKKSIFYNKLNEILLSYIRDIIINDILA